MEEQNRHVSDLQEVVAPIVYAGKLPKRNKSFQYESVERKQARFLSETDIVGVIEFAGPRIIADPESYSRNEIVEAFQQQVNTLQQEAEKWRKEAFRKYPTPEAYDAVCKALEKHRERADAAEQQVNMLTEALMFYAEKKHLSMHWCEDGERAREALQSIKESPREEQTPKDRGVEG